MQLTYSLISETKVMLGYAHLINHHVCVCVCTHTPTSNRKLIKNIKLIHPLARTIN